MSSSSRPWFALFALAAACGAEPVSPVPELSPSTLAPVRVPWQGRTLPWAFGALGRSTVAPLEPSWAPRPLRPSVEGCLSARARYRERVAQAEARLDAMVVGGVSGGALDAEGRSLDAALRAERRALEARRDPVIEALGASPEALSQGGWWLLGELQFEAAVDRYLALEERADEAVARCQPPCDPDALPSPPPPEVDPALASYRRAFAGPDPTLSLAARDGSAHALEYALRLDEAEAHYRAVGSLELSQGAVVEARLWLGRRAWQRGSLDEAAGHLQRAVALAERLAHPLEYESRASLAELELHRGRPSETLSLLVGLSRREAPPSARSFSQRARELFTASLEDLGGDATAWLERLPPSERDSVSSALERPPSGSLPEVLSWASSRCYRRLPEAVPGEVSLRLEAGRSLGQGTRVLVTSRSTELAGCLRALVSARVTLPPGAVVVAALVFGDLEGAMGALAARRPPGSPFPDAGTSE